MNYGIFVCLRSQVIHLERRKFILLIFYIQFLMYYDYRRCASCVACCFCFLFFILNFKRSQVLFVNNERFLDDILYWYVLRKQE